MGDDGIDNATKLRFDFYKNMATLSLATLGGEITLLNTLYARVNNKTLAYVSICSVVVAALLIHIAQEVLVNRVSPRPNFPVRLLNKLWGPRSLETEYAYTFVSAITFGLGVTLFAIFAMSV
jgi:hypothetical protein